MIVSTLRSLTAGVSMPGEYTRLRAASSCEREDVMRCRAQVFKVGFFIDADTGQSANGRRSTVNVIVPSRSQQLRLLKRELLRLLTADWAPTARENHED